MTSIVTSTRYPQKSTIHLTVVPLAVPVVQLLCGLLASSAVVSDDRLTRVRPEGAAVAQVRARDGDRGARAGRAAAQAAAQRTRLLVEMRESPRRLSTCPTDMRSSIRIGGRNG